jgi:hypothetical protein
VPDPDELDELVLAAGLATELFEDDPHATTSTVALSRAVTAVARPAVLILLPHSSEPVTHDRAPF